MKKILLAMLIVTTMLIAFLALSAANDVTKSITNATNTTLGLNVTKSITNATNTTLGPNVTKSITSTTSTIPGPEATKPTLAKTSGGDYLNPNSISSGYYINFPWYSSDVSFTSYEFNDSTFSYFEEYYTSPSITVISGIISTPIQFDIAQKTPSWIYFGTGQPLPYTQYVATVPSRTNELWVQGATDWSQYVVSPLGTWLQLVSYASDGGSAGFYEIVQTDTTTQEYSTYQFNQGYNAMYFKADQVGRHILFFVVKNQPSNVVIVDVFAKAQPGSMPPTSIR